MSIMIASRKGRKGRKDGHEPCAQTRPRFVGQSVDNGLDPVLGASFAKVDQQLRPVTTAPNLFTLPSTFASFATFA